MRCIDTYKCHISKEREIKAWLITWEWSGDHAKVEDNIAAILNSRLSGKHVRDIVELLYVNSQYGPSERLSYATGKKFNPYSAEFGTLEGVPFEGEIICGHNPYLHARSVDDCHVVGKDGDEKLTWKEIPKPKVAAFHNRS
jgi:hypothetical protein